MFTIVCIRIWKFIWSCALRSSNWEHRARIRIGINGHDSSFLFLILPEHKCLVVRRNFQKVN